jgi:hypothetical protein
MDKSAIERFLHAVDDHLAKLAAEGERLLGKYASDLRKGSRADKFTSAFHGRHMRNDQTDIPKIHFHCPRETK